MPNLTISLERGKLLKRVPIALKVIDETLEIVWEGTIEIGGSQTIEVTPGKFSIQATLPSGQKKNVTCDLKEESRSVVINVIGESPRETLEWANLNNQAQVVRAEQTDDTFRSVWLKMWHRQPGGQWEHKSWDGFMPETEPGLIQFHFNFLGHPGQYFLQCGADKMQWRLFALPADNIQVLIKDNQPLREADPADSRVSVIVSSKNPEAEALLGYFQNGQFDQAEMVNKIIAEKLLHKKLSNPAAAVIAGYYLLGLNDLEKLHQVWSDNLANWIDWFPDGSVINAWYHLRRKNPNVKTIRQHLLEAVKRGIPVYTRGVRLLLDGLTIIGDAEDQNSDTAVTVQTALKLVRSYGSALDWRSITTSFLGLDPDSPCKVMVGSPDDTWNILLIADIYDNKVEWNRGGRKSTNRQKTSLNTRFPKINQQLMISQNSTVSLKNHPLIKSSEESLINTRIKLSKNPPKTSLKQIVKSNSPERIMARIFNLAETQTEGESLSDTKPVDLLPGTSIHGTAFERIIGSSNLLSTSFFERGIIAARTVGRIAVQNNRSEIINYANGFLVSPRLLLTNNHVISGLKQARMCFVEFDYQDRANGQLRQKRRFELAPEDFFVTNSHMDFSLIALKPSSDESASPINFGWNRLSEASGKVIIGEYLSSIQHLDGAPKQIAVREFQLIDFFDDFLHCRQPMTALSSGAPLFNDQWEVVGINHASTIDPVNAENTLAGNDQSSTSRDAAKNLWLVHEAVRTSRIVQFVKTVKLSKKQMVFRDEMLFLNPSCPDFP